MSDRYPSDVELEAIRYWDKTLKELLDFIEEIYEYDPPRLRVGRSGFDRKKCYKYEIHTWGWSGNEDIVEALRRTMFWFTFWQKSERGGHFYFEIPTWALDSDKVEWGDPIKIA